MEYERWKIGRFAIVVMIMLTVFSGCAGTPGNEERGTTIRISGAWALYPMMLVWADEYEKTYDITIEVSGGGAGKGVSDTLNNQVNIGMLSRPPRKEEIDQGMFYIAVVKDSVVATVNKNNPVLEIIYTQGLSQEDLRKIFLGEITHWGDVVGEDLENDEIVVYGRSDASGAAKVWAAFLGDYTQAELQDRANANFNGDQPLANGIKSNANAIGFNNLNYAYDIETGGFAEGIVPVPLDLNGNNLLDADEDFYTTREVFLEAVSIGKYPSPPARSVYVVSKGPFQGAVKEFIYWILTDGQALVRENGYVELLEEELSQEISFLEEGRRV